VPRPTLKKRAQELYCAKTTLQHVLVPRQTLKKRAQELYWRKSTLQHVLVPRADTEEARAGAIRAKTTLQHVLVPRRTLKKRAQELYVRTQPYNTFWCHDTHKTVHNSYTNRVKPLVSGQTHTEIRPLTALKLRDAPQVEEH
jgi:hypothetical protein